MTTGTNMGVQAVTGFATELAVLEMSADEASYQADKLTRDAERAAAREHAAEKIRAMREKASEMKLHALVDAGIMASSAGVQGIGADAGYDADMAKVHNTCDPEANLVSRICDAVSKTEDTSIKVSDLSYGSIESGLDATSAEQAQAAEEAKERADEANTAANRTLSQNDQKLAVIQEMLRSDSELMHTLISRS